MPGFENAEKYAGVLALACFSGVFLGGMLLSYFWKVFGPWKQLESAQSQIRDCNAKMDDMRRDNARTQTELTEIKTRYEMMQEAMKSGWFRLPGR